MLKTALFILLRVLLSISFVFLFFFSCPTGGYQVVGLLNFRKVLVTFPDPGAAVSVETLLYSYLPVLGGAKITSQGRKKKANDAFTVLGPRLQHSRLCPEPLLTLYLQMVKTRKHFI